MAGSSILARSFFSEAEDRAIVAAIRAAEAETSGEIRVHLEDRAPGGDAYRRAWQLFGQLGMHQTAARNGVLIYFAIEDHKFAIFADQGIHQVVPPGYWDEIARQMQARFREKEFAEGLAGGIVRIGGYLKQYFPRQSRDLNELSDDISYSDH
ncbi:MAG: TPM domain-containing protein [Bacteroidia bacterium]|nr:TPM domain-containing protein [Bacteroidia bacterium]